jgi:hypothetical protein
LVRLSVRWLACGPLVDGDGKKPTPSGFNTGDVLLLLVEEAAGATAFSVDKGGFPGELENDERATRTGE